jgi:hypothetical protein
MLAEQPDDSHPVGGTLEKPDKTPRLAIALSFTLFAAYAYKLIRPRK